MESSPEFRLEIGWWKFGGLKHRAGNLANVENRFTELIYYVS